jgi:hypothetical protein
MRPAFAVGIVIALQAVSIAAPRGAAGISINDDVTFEALGQSLLGSNAGQGQATRTIPFGTTPLFSDRRGPITAGTIYHLDQPIPVETAQAIWQAAIEICTTRLTRTQIVSIEIPVIGTVSRSCRGTATPTQAQCINGGTINPLLSATCCIYGGNYPNCTDGLGPDTLTVSTNLLSFNVGPGIGPRPTTGTTRPYDIGIVASVRSDVEVGIEGELTLDGGSVDVTYPTTVRLTTSADSVVPGDVFAVWGTHVPAAPSLVTEYPNISLALSTYSRIDAGADVQYAGIDFATGNQVRGTQMIDAFSTADDPQADEMGRVINQIIEVKAGVGAGLQVSVNTDVSIGGIEATQLDPIGPFILPLAFPFDITIPPKPAPFCEVVPRPDCSFNPPVSTDVVELLFRTPFLNTPAFPDFDGGNDFTGVAGDDEPIGQARNQLLADGAVRNTTITGKRDALESSLEAVGGDLSKLSISDGIVDTDLLRIGVDIDGSLAGFGLPPGGATLELPPQLPAGFPIAKLAGKRLLEVEANLIDLDAVDFLYFDQEIIFRPNLIVELVFDKPVAVRAADMVAFEEVVANALGEYVVELPLEADRLGAVEVIQPEGGVTVTPRYSVAANELENNLDWLVNSGIQGTVGQITIGGFLAAIVAPIVSGVSDVEELNFALGQFAPTFDEPLRFPAHDSFTLAGFGEAIVGTAFSVATRITPAPRCAGDCDGDDLVTVDEVVTLVNVALGVNPAAACNAGDVDGDRAVTVDEIIRGLGIALMGCFVEASSSAGGGDRTRTRETRTGF